MYAREGLIGPRVPSKYSWGWYRAGNYYDGYFFPIPETEAFLPLSVSAAMSSNDHIYRGSWVAVVWELAMALSRVKLDVSLDPQNPR
jgi:hypothetical protein